MTEAPLVWWPGMPELISHFETAHSGVVRFSRDVGQRRSRGDAGLQNMGAGDRANVNPFRAKCCRKCF